MILVIQLVTLSTGAIENINIEDIEPEKEYTIYGYELINIVNELNKISHLEETNEILEYRLELERNAFERVIEKENKKSEINDEIIELLLEDKRQSRIERYTKYGSVFVIGVASGIIIGYVAK